MEPKYTYTETLDGISTIGEVFEEPIFKRSDYEIHTRFTFKNAESGHVINQYYFEPKLSKEELEKEVNNFSLHYKSKNTLQYGNN